MSAIEPARKRDPRIPVSPGLALRVAIIGGVAIAMFGVIFFRLWYLQVLSGEQYVQQANANRVRDLPIPAPRGEILDREGQPIVDEPRRPTRCRSCPPRCRRRGRRASPSTASSVALLGMSAAHIEAIVVNERLAVPYAPVTIKTDAGPAC